MDRKDLKVFVVDDDPNFGKATEAALTRAGFGVQLYSKPDDVLKATQIQFPHVLLVDCLLPKISGVNLVTQLREQGAKDTHVIFMSGIYKDKAFIKDTLQKTQAAAFLTKPFDLNDLIREVEGVLVNLLFDESLQAPFLEILTRPSTNVKDRLAVIAATKEIHGYELPRFLSLLLDRTTTGILSLKDSKDGISKVYIHEGSITRVDMSSPNSLFGALLVEKNLVTVGALESLLKEPSKTPIGQRLIEANLLSPHIIQIINSEQAEVRLSKLVADVSYSVKFSIEAIKETEPTITRHRLAILFSDWIYSKISPAWLKTFYLPWMGFHINKTGTYNEKSPFFNLPPLSLIPDLSQKVTKGLSVQEMTSDKKYSEDEILGSIHLLVLAGMVAFDKKVSKGEMTLSVDKLTRVLHEMKPKTFFQILGVSTSSSGADIKKAYHELAKTFHPDRLPTTASKEVRELTQNIFSQMTAAYETLKEDEKRGVYVKQLEHGRAEVIIQAESLLDEALALIKTNNSSKALEKLKAATNLGVQTAEIQLHTLWAKLLQIPTGQSSQSKLLPIQTALNKIAPEDRHTALYFFVKGLTMKAAGETDVAINSFKKALYLTPTFSEASRELKVMQSVKNKPAPDLLHADLKDVVGMIFKKKKS